MHSLLEYFTRAVLIVDDRMFVLQISFIFVTKQIWWDWIALWEWWNSSVLGSVAKIWKKT